MTVLDRGLGIPTIKDVAERAGVSISAVSIYLNDKPGISRATYERIGLAIAELGYIPRNSTRRTATNRYLSLLVEKMPLSLRVDNFYAEVTESIQTETELLGYHLTINILNQNEMPRAIVDQHIDGVVAVGGGDITDELLVQISNHNTPLIAVDNLCLLQDIDSVMGDNVRGAYLATQHLLGLGHRRIAIIRGPVKYKPLTERYYGYMRAMLEAGIMPDESLIQNPLSHGILRKGYLEIENLMRTKNPPTAIFAVTDRTALGAMDYLKEQEFRIPEDISIASFDDIRPDAYSHPALTTVSIDRHEMGRLAVRRLHERIQSPTLKPVKFVMYPRLVVRDSTAPLKG